MSSDDGQPWLRELQRRSPWDRLKDSTDDIFVEDTPYFTKAFAEREWYYLVGLANGNVWRCSGMRLANREADVVRLLHPSLVSPAAETNLLAGVDVRLCDISWVADSQQQL